MLGSLRLTALVALVVGCTPHGAEVTPTQAAKPAPSVQAAPSTAPPTETSAASTPAPVAASPDAGTASTEASDEPAASASPPPIEEAPLLDESGTALPQTEERPTTDSPLFGAHVEALFAAIVADDPALAMPFFFPRVAYEQVKDIQNPGADWERRLVRAFERNVHEYHRALGKHADGATLIGLEVPESRVQWMKPGREGNRIGYYRVLHSRLRWRDTAGKERALDVTSLISWRGHWYLVHLHGFK